MSGIISTRARAVAKARGAQASAGCTSAVGASARSRGLRGDRALVGLLAALAMTAALSACSSTGSGAPAAAPLAAAAATATATSAPTPDGSSDATDGGATATPAAPLPNTVTGAPTKAPRPGQGSTPTVSASASGFSTPVDYGDKVTVSVTKATKQVEAGNGPGVFAGREFVVFDVELHNGTAQPIDLNSVVVTTYYGGTNQLAAPVYTPSAQTADFGGTVAPGDKASARFGFAVPSSELGNVTMVVDFDSAHSSATFTGSVPTS